MCLIEDQSWIDCIDITSRWDTFVLFHLYGNKGVSLPLWPIRPRWFHTYSPCAEPLGDSHEGMWARFGSQGSIALNWHSRYSGTRYSGTWLYKKKIKLLSIIWDQVSSMCINHQMGCGDLTRPRGYQGLHSLSRRTSYRKISWSLEAVRFRFILFQLLLYLTGISAAVLLRCLSNFRAIQSS